MKKIKFICFLLFVSIAAIAQNPFPVISKQGSPSTLGKSLGGIKADSLFINAVYLDTTAANKNPYNKTYIGGQIYTTSDSSIWLWQGKWIKAKGSSGGGGGAAYTITKNATRDTIILSDGSNITKIKDSVGVPQNLQQVTSIDSVTTRKVTVKGFGNTGIRTYENNAAALADSLRPDKLVEGDEYYLPYNDGAYRKATVVYPPPPPITATFLVGNNGVASIQVYIGGIVLTTYSTNWGDGTINNSFTHTYATAGTYIATFQVLYHLNISVINQNSENMIAYSQPFLPSLINLALVNQKFPQIEINAILVMMNNYGYAGVLDLQALIPTPPSGAGITAKNAIIARGGIVITD